MSCRLSGLATAHAAPVMVNSVLLVKTSSLGDVIHALPAVSDMRARISLTAGKAWMTSPSDEVFTSRTLLTITGAAWAVANPLSLHDIAVSA